MADGDTGGFLEGAFEEEEDDDDLDGFLDGIDDEDETETESSSTGFGGVQYKPEVHYHSSEDMSELEDSSVELVVTSPPYNVGWGYGDVDDAMHYSDEYLPMLARIFQECYRVLRPGGRLCINVPTLVRDGATGGFSLSSDIRTMMNRRQGAFWLHPEKTHDDVLDLQTQCDWLEREFVVWNKGFNTDGLAPNGSFPRPWGILLNNMHESLIIFQKPGDRNYDNMDEERIENSKINKWTDDLCDDVWDISPENHEFDYAEDQEVPPFPEELVKRCIALYTYEDDTVLDPFFGRGTTGKMAKQMDRNSVGYELREELKRDIEEYTGMNQAQLF